MSVDQFNSMLHLLAAYFEHIISSLQSDTEVPSKKDQAFRDTFALRFDDQSVDLVAVNVSNKTFRRYDCKIDHLPILFLFDCKIVDSCFLIMGVTVFTYNTTAIH